VVLGAGHLGVEAGLFGALEVYPDWPVVGVHGHQVVPLVERVERPVWQAESEVHYVSAVEQCAAA
jgi:hypothetical protein